MCTFNGARHLPEQLASIAEQTRPPDELVVCDDHSSDETARVVEGFAAAARFPVRLHVNERNLGSTQNFGKAISLCAGDLIALCDQDDVWMTGKLERIEAVFGARPRVGLVFTDAELVDESLRPLGHRLWERVGFDDEMRRLVGVGRALDVLLPGWTVTGATMAFRSAFTPLVLEIPDDLAMIHDGWIALIVGAVADVSFIDEPLVKYRQHPRQQIGAPQRGESEAKGLGEVRAALGRSNQYAELIQIGERVRRRLAERCERFGCAESLARLDERLAHLRARGGMPAVSRLGRLPRILRELMSRRYHLYSNGVYSAVKDLLA
jgi:glycosyltransferase involved in cell wall biosynthesis